MSQKTVLVLVLFSFSEKLNFFGNDPQNTSVEIGKTAILNCRVQANDPSTKIQWLKKLDIQQLFRPEAIVFGSEQYENIEQSQEQQYSNNILSKPLVFAQVTTKEKGQYICLIQNDKATNYKKAFINVIDNHKGKKNALIDRYLQIMTIYFSQV
jgi:CHAT domain-containing protein